MQILPDKSSSAYAGTGIVGGQRGERFRRNPVLDFRGRVVFHRGIAADRAGRVRSRQVSIEVRLPVRAHFIIDLVEHVRYGRTVEQESHFSVVHAILVVFGQRKGERGAGVPVVGRFIPDPSVANNDVPIRGPRVLQSLCNRNQPAAVLYELQHQRGPTVRAQMFPRGDARIGERIVDRRIVPDRRHRRERQRSFKSIRGRSGRCRNSKSVRITHNRGRLSCAHQRCVRIDSPADHAGARKRIARHGSHLSERRKTSHRCPEEKRLNKICSDKTSIKMRRFHWVASSGGRPGLVELISLAGLYLEGFPCERKIMSPVICAHFM